MYGCFRMLVTAHARCTRRYYHSHCSQHHACIMSIGQSALGHVDWYVAYKLCDVQENYLSHARTHITYAPCHPQCIPLQAERICLWIVPKLIKVCMHALVTINPYVLGPLFRVSAVHGHISRLCLQHLQVNSNCLHRFSLADNV